MFSRNIIIHAIMIKLVAGRGQGRKIDERIEFTGYFVFRTMNRVAVVINGAIIDHT